MSSGAKEKKAVSEPEMRADPKSRIISIKRPIITLKSIGFTIITE
jgi:hypothetical protein